MSDDSPKTARSDEEVPRTIAVGFRVPGQTEFFTEGDVQTVVGESVVVTSNEHPRVGKVLKIFDESKAPHADRSIERRLDDADRRALVQNTKREHEALQFCQKRIEAQKLAMKLVSVEFALDGGQAVFFFTSPDRVDFRSLVKELAQRFHTRIEMRQIGVRDAARFEGGAGMCGRELCCSTWLVEFKPISIRLAKDQNLALNHDKLSGVCGRLRCCLAYEHEVYLSHKQGLPKIGKTIVTPRGEARVRDVNILRRRIRVQFADGSYDEFAAETLQNALPKEKDVQYDADKPKGTA